MTLSVSLSHSESFISFVVPRHHKHHAFGERDDRRPVREEKRKRAVFAFNDAELIIPDHGDGSGFSDLVFGNIYKCVGDPFICGIIFSEQLINEIRKSTVERFKMLFFQFCKRSERFREAVRLE